MQADGPHMHKAPFVDAIGVTQGVNLKWARHRKEAILEKERNPLIRHRETPYHRIFFAPLPFDLHCRESAICLFLSMRLGPWHPMQVADKSVIYLSYM
jgi:hypothetical protein